MLIAFSFVRDGERNKSEMKSTLDIRCRGSLSIMRHSYS